MKTNDLKKGDIVVLKNGWQARIEDNKRGNVRTATVFGYVTEMGSIYGHNIVSHKKDGKTIKIEYTPEQVKMQQLGW